MKEILINIIIVLIVLTIISFALIYIIKSKKNGQKCIGCPYSKTCNKQNNCSCDKNK